MKYVTLLTTAIIAGLPRGPNDGRQLVTNAQADHLRDMRLVNPDAIEDAPDAFSALDRLDQDDEATKPAVDTKAVDKAVKAQLKTLRADDAEKLKTALAAQEAKGNEALDAELQRIRSDGESSLAEALERQTAEQNEKFAAQVDEAVKAKLAE